MLLFISYKSNIYSYSTIITCLKESLLFGRIEAVTFLYTNMSSDERSRGNSSGNPFNRYHFTFFRHKCGFGRSLDEMSFDTHAIEQFENLARSRRRYGCFAHQIMSSCPISGSNPILRLNQN